MEPLEPQFRPAQESDVPQLRALYNDIIDAMDASRWHARWRKDGYPSDADLAAAARAGELQLCLVAGEVAGAMVLNHEYNAGYEQAPWAVDCSAAEVLCIHTLGVSPRFQRQGVAAAMVRHAAGVARACGCKCLRLDVIEGNLPADLLYQRLGFEFRGAYQLRYDSVCAEFNLYEYVL